MAKVILNDLANLNNDNTVIATLNANNANIEAAMENTLSRDGTTPNQMNSNLDMNSYHINNLPEPSSDTDPVRLIDLTNVSEVTNVLHTASSTSVTIGLGAKTFTVPSGLGFFAGQFILVQVSGDTTKYMLARVTSYSGTSLVINSLVSAGAGTFNNWLIDLSGAQGTASVVYDTVANADVATIDAALSFLPLAGYTTIGDGGDGLYKREVGMPADAGRFQSTDGSWWHLVSRDVTPEMFGCVGDGVADDRANLQNCIDFVNLRGGGNIQLTPGKTYRAVLTGANELQNKSGVNFFFNGASISLEQSGTALGFRMNSNTRLIGPGNLLCPVSTGPSAQGIYHATISFGNINGGDGTVGAPSALSTINNIVVDGLTITNARADGNGSMVQGLGGCHDITIQNCIFPDTAAANGAVGFDWGYYGVLNSSDINLSRTNYDAGTAYTIHPHNLVIRNNQIGNLTNTLLAGTHGVRLSGTYNVTVEGNDIQSTTGAGIFITGGDMGFEFAPNEVRQNSCRNITIENNNIHNYKAGYGIRYDSYPDNVQDAVVNPANPSYPYVAIGTTDGYNVNGRIVGNKFQTLSTVNAVEGVFISYTKGLYIGQNIINGGLFSQRGVRLSNGCTNVIVEGNDIALFQEAGVYINESSFLPTNCIIRNNYVYRNGNSGANNANILISGSVGTIVEGNLVGTTSEDQALSGIRINSGSVSTSVKGNLVQEVKAGGTAFNLAYGNNITAIWEFSGNDYRGAQTYVSGTSIVPYRRDYSVVGGSQIQTHAQATRGSLAGDITPTFGTWGIGSTVINVDAAATGHVALTKCTVSGTPGTWKAMSTLP